MATATQQIEVPVETHSKPPGIISGELGRLAVHASHYLAGLIVSFTIGLISFPIFTRVFPVAEYGLVDLAQRTMLLLWAVSKIGLQNAALRFYDGPRFDAEPDARRQYFSTLYFGVLASAIVVASGFFVLAAIVPQTAVSGPLLGLLYFIIALLLLRSMSSMLWTFLRVEERTKAYNFITVGMKAATVIAVCALLPFAGHVARTYFIGVILVEATLVFGLTIPLVRRNLLRPKFFDSTLLRAGIKYSAPLVIYEFSFTLLGSTDRFLVRHFLGGDAQGFYSVAYGLAANLNELLIAPLGLALTPIYMRIWTTEGRKKTVDFLSLSFDLYLMAAVLMVAMAAACARDIVQVLASSKYLGAERMIPILLTGLLIYTAHLFLAAGLLIYKRTMEMAGILIGAAAVNVCLNWMLLPRIGVAGGAISAVLSYSMCIVLLTMVSRSLLPVHFQARRFMLYLFAGAVAWLACSFIQAGAPAINLAAKAIMGLAIYGAFMYAFNERARTTVQKLRLAYSGRSVE